MTWRVARSLDVMLLEINTAAPNRGKAADGSIGDASHSSRYSDHNPNPAGVVRARDITHDPARGCDAGELAEAIRQLAIKGHPALGSGAYIIWNWRIASATYGWEWRKYTGSNGHTQHVHVSVATAASGYDSPAPWGITEEDDMALSPDDKTWLRTTMREQIDASIKQAIPEIADEVLGSQVISRLDVTVREALRHGSGKKAAKADDEKEVGK